MSHGSRRAVQLAVHLSFAQHVSPRHVEHGLLCARCSRRARRCRRWHRNEVLPVLWKQTDRATLNAGTSFNANPPPQMGPQIQTADTRCRRTLAPAPLLRIILRELRLQARGSDISVHGRCPAKFLNLNISLYG